MKKFCTVSIFNFIHWAWGEVCPLIALLLVLLQQCQSRRIIYVPGDYASHLDSAIALEKGTCGHHSPNSVSPDHRTHHNQKSYPRRLPILLAVLVRIRCTILRRLEATQYSSLASSRAVKRVINVAACWLSFRNCVCSLLCQLINERARIQRPSATAQFVFSSCNAISTTTHARCPK